MEGRAWLGALLSSDGEQGVRIEWVHPEGPAATAGLKSGDVLLKLGETEVGEAEDVVSAVREKEPGEELAVVARRGDEEQEFTVELGSMERFSRRFGPPTDWLFGDVPFPRTWLREFPEPRGEPEDLRERLRDMRQRMEELEEEMEKLRREAFKAREAKETSQQ